MDEVVSDVVVVGAGPAGLATAIAACRRDPDATRRIVVLDRATFPRHKACGGVVTERGMEALAELGLEPAVAAVGVRCEEWRDGGQSWRSPEASTSQYSIFDRTDFDAWLLAEARAIGVEVREGALVRRARLAHGLVHLETTGGRYIACVVVAADGANSVVVRCLRGDRIRLARLLEGVAPRPATVEAHTTVFDFETARLAGVQGYLWTFPSVKGSQATVNVGVYDSRVYPTDRSVALRPLLERHVRELGGLPELVVTSHPLRRWEPSARPAEASLLVVGDALGADVLIGEGISYALVAGSLAGRALVESAFDPVVSAELYSRWLLDSPAWEALSLCRDGALERYRFAAG